MFTAMTVVGLVMALALPAENAWGGSKVFAAFGTTSTMRGTVETNAFANRDPFVLQVFSGAGECLRLAVTSQGTDLEMTLVAPGGRVWQDDDSNGALRPRIFAVTNIRGWHTLNLSHFSGASVNADFVMTIFRGAAATCVPLTAPRILADPQQADKPGTSGPGPQGGTNN
jgi:hypothetical protein